jgi:outer membrane usher protein FimD/PapC
MSVIGDINVITANLSAYRTDYKGRKDDSISLSLSVPIGDNSWEWMDIQTNNGKTSPMVSYTDNSDA